MQKQSTASRFWAKVIRDGPIPEGRPDLGHCWIWTGSTATGGYGSFRDTGRVRVSAHRYSYKRFVGPIPPGLELDHLCRIKACVNPFHLEAVTHRENIVRGTSWNRGKTHCKQGHAFTPENTRWLRGRRGCRKCHADERRRRFARRRAAGQ